MHLQGGQQSFPFAMTLNPSSLPSIAQVRNCTVSYYARPVLVANGATIAGNPVAFMVILPMSGQLWNCPSAKQDEKSLPVVCCCCISRGQLTARYVMSKTCIALDRDQVSVQVMIDNTKSGSKVDNVIMALTCVGHVKVGHICTFSSVAGSVTIPANVEPGATKEVTGTIVFNPQSPPTFQSSVVDISYSLSARLDMSWATDVTVGFPVFVAHSVDMSNAISQLQQGFMSFQPMAQSQMYVAPPTDAPLFAAAPPPFYAGLPPIQFEQFPVNNADDNDDAGDGGGGGDGGGAAGGGAAFGGGGGSYQAPQLMSMVMAQQFNGQQQPPQAVAWL